eukprot:841560-Prorocentrum_lima.AAC.1
MTSSLVGSEMCIRDRSRHYALTAAWIGDMVVTEGVEVQYQPGKSIVTAVSYTHLTLPTICSV